MSIEYTCKTKSKNFLPKTYTYWFDDILYKITENDGAYKIAMKLGLIDGRGARVVCVTWIMWFSCNLKETEKEKFSLSFRKRYLISAVSYLLFFILYQLAKYFYPHYCKLVYGQGCCCPFLSELFNLQLYQIIIGWVIRMRLQQLNNILFFNSFKVNIVCKIQVSYGSRAFFWTCPKSEKPCIHSGFILPHTTFITTGENLES